MLRGNPPPNILFFLFPSLFKKNQNFFFWGGLNLLNPPPHKYALDTTHNPIRSGDNNGIHLFTMANWSSLSSHRLNLAIQSSKSSDIVMLYRNLRKSFTMATVKLVSLKCQLISQNHYSNYIMHVLYKYL